MSYLYSSSKIKIEQFISAPSGWFAIFWDGEDGYYPCSVAMWAIGKFEEYPAIRMFPVIGDNEIGGTFHVVGDNEHDDYFIGYIEPDGEPPDHDEIKIRIDIARELIEEKKLETAQEVEPKS